jgi:hypothetical protein
MKARLTDEGIKTPRRHPVKIADGVKFLLEDEPPESSGPVHPCTDWHHWNPGLDNDDTTLAEVHATLPGNRANDIDLMVKLIENPKSPYAITGAISLPDHDCVHILLGRGLLPQDEAFVIGYTMGTAGAAIAHDDVKLFKLISSHLYPDIYRFSRNDLIAYDLGFSVGQKALRPVYEFDFMQNTHRTLGELRAIFGLDVRELRRVYRRERRRIPGTAASARLPV